MYANIKNVFNLNMEQKFSTDLHSNSYLIHMRQAIKTYRVLQLLLLNETECALR